MRVAFVQAVFLVCCLSVAGLAHVAWLRSRAADPFRRPLDGARTWRGKPLLGANKTWAGVMALPVAGAFALALGYAVAPAALAAHLWPLTGPQRLGLGFVLGAAFVLAELPNSFLKRRLAVAPGERPQRGALALVLPLVDRFDSLAGVLLALALTIGLSAALAGFVVMLGVLAHATFSVFMHRLGMKKRAL